MLSKFAIDMQNNTQKAVEHYTNHSDTISGQGLLFVASKGWLWTFLKRWGLSIHRYTTVGQRLPSDPVDEIVQFIMSTRKLNIQNNSSPNAIRNMDETLLWISMPSHMNIPRTGVKLGSLLISVHEKINLLCIWQQWLIGKSWRHLLCLKVKTGSEAFKVSWSGSYIW